MQQFRKPDLSAPRYRVRKKNLITDNYVSDFYEKYPNLKKYNKKDIRDIIKLFNGILWNDIIENRDGVELPESLGYVFVGSCPSVKKENVDYAKSIKYGIKVTHKNYDTDGHLGKIFFSNYSAKYKLKDRSIWSFSGSRVFKRTVTKKFKEDWKKYIVIDNTIRISKMYLNAKSKTYNDKIINDPNNKFNEFNLE